MSLAQRLERHGLFLRGVVRLEPDELRRHGFDAARPQLALVGNIGSSYWPVFSAAAEYHDGAAHPLDRWSRRVAQALADEYDLRPVYPFDGPPYYPFQQWASRAENLQQSPIGVMIHPEYGLWHSYRFALLGAGFEPAAAPAASSPCLECVARPCLRRCPVNAFDARGYDVPACTDYLRQSADAQCHRQGCLARHACPVAPRLRYLPAQGRFHLRAFLGLEHRP